MSGNEIIGGMAVLLGVGSYLAYLWQMFRRTVSPHVFSWFIWGTIGLITFAAQYVTEAGPGAWATGSSALFCYIIAAAGLFYGEKNITRSDWGCLIFSLAAIPVWMATSNPLWAVVMTSLIDAVAFYPTFRKSWIRPHQEGMVVFFIYALQMGLAIAAVENVTLTTVLYPATVFSLNMLLVSMLLYRRKALPC